MRFMGDAVEGPKGRRPGRPRTGEPGAGPDVGYGGSTAPRRVTMSDIATEAGVSVATVSKVLNGSDRVSEETRTRVQGLLSEHKYERRLAAATGLPR